MTFACAAPESRDGGGWRTRSRGTIGLRTAGTTKESPTPDTATEDHIAVSTGGRARAGAVIAASAAVACSVVTGCGSATLPGASEQPGAGHAATSTSDASASTAGTTARVAAPVSTSRSSVVVAAPVRATSARVQSPASLSIPSIGVRGLTVVPYVGSPDDVPGTRIADSGAAATPRGPRGGAAFGSVGNAIITAHRTSAGGPLRDLPSLRTGAHILISSGGMVFDYVVVSTLVVSFRSAASLALQSAAVPGHPGQRATRAMVTLSTCATPEDHARGNYWADALGNPEHRIDKVGVLVAVRDQ